MICWSKGTEANITPVTPPITKTKTKPMMNSIGVLNTGRPEMIVAIQAKIWTPEGMVMSMLAAEKNAMDRLGSPTANMWWTQTPKPMIAVAMVARASQT